MSGIEIARTVADLRGRLHGWREAGGRLALVPTMGALHEGHLALVRHARGIADRVCVSLFVNPTQFGPNEDYAIYPRDEAADAAKLTALGADLLFAPEVEEMYPGGAATRVSVAGLGDLLEGEHRPGFFTGVATIVAKLLLQAMPDIAVFGEKDYQQLLVIRQLVKDLDLPIKIIAGAIVREEDGLAMSSRNAYLDTTARAIAPRFHTVLEEVSKDLSEGRPVHEATFLGRDWLEGAGFKVDYLEVRDAAHLMPVGQYVTVPGRVLGAVYLGHVRLIDNVAVAPVKTG